LGGGPGPSPWLPGGGGVDGLASLPTIQRFEPLAEILHTKTKPKKLGPRAFLEAGCTPRTGRPLGAFAYPLSFPRAIPPIDLHEVHGAR